MLTVQAANIYDLCTIMYNLWRHAYNLNYNMFKSRHKKTENLIYEYSCNIMI